MTVLLSLFSVFAFANSGDIKKEEITNEAPSLANIPDQIMLPDGSFADLDLRNYLTEPDGDDVEWTYFFKNTLSNQEVVPDDWNYNNQTPSMTMLAQIKIRGEYPDANGDQLTAFHNGIVKGTTEAIQVARDYWLFFLTIDGDTGPTADTITFQYFDADQSTIFEVDVDSTIVFSSQQTIGSAGAPFQMDAGFISVLDEGIPNEGIFYPRAYEPDWVGRDTVYVVARELGTADNFSDTTMVIFKTSGDVLPVDLLSFSGNEMNNQSRLKWEIANPENVLAYQIQRRNSNSFTNADWEVLGFVPHSDDKSFYKYLDELPIRGTNYYRLKIIDLDESFEFSPIISVYIEELENVELNIFPNPIFANQELFISMKTENTTTVDIQIVDQLGKPLQHILLATENVIQYFPIDITAFPGGIYFAKVKVGHRVFKRSFVVNKD